MTAQAPLPEDDPRMIAWSAYTKTEEYANTKKWALHPQHVDGSLWAAFIEGFRAAIAPATKSAPPVKDYMELSLATARVLRAHLVDMRDTPIAQDLCLSDDIEAMTEALEPFNPDDGEPVNLEGAPERTHHECKHAAGYKVVA